MKAPPVALREDGVKALRLGVGEGKGGDGCCWWGGDSFGAPCLFGRVSFFPPAVVAVAEAEEEERRENVNVIHFHWRNEGKNNELNFL